MSAIGSVNISWGDTLSQIALRAGTTIQQIQALNPQITNPDMIYAGDTLRLSGAEPAPGASVNYRVRARNAAGVGAESDVVQGHRAEAALAQRQTPAPIDSAALHAELFSLLHTGG